MESQKRYLELDSLRGLAALTVVFYHIAMYFKLNVERYSVFDDLFLHGNLGVQLFFIISGFVIYMSMQKHPDPKAFLISRFSKLYPTYWTCVILTFIVISITPYWTIPVTFNEMLINLTMFQHWFRVRDVDGVYWTLAIELCFYMMVLFILIFKKVEKIEWFGLAWLMVMLLVYFLSKYIPGTLDLYYWIPLLKNGTLFCAGIIFYLMRTQGQTPQRFFYLALCLGIHFVINPLLESVVVTAYFLIFLLVVQNKMSFLINKPLLFLGNISYALYLINQEVGYQVLNVTETLGLTTPFLRIVFSLSGIIVLAAGITFYIERPVMKWIRAFFNHSATK